MTSKNKNGGWGGTIYNTILAGGIAGVVGGLTFYGANQAGENVDSVLNNLNPPEQEVQEENYNEGNTTHNEINIDKSGDNRIEDSEINIERDDVVDTYELDCFDRPAYEIIIDSEPRYLVPHHNHGYTWGNIHRRDGDYFHVSGRWGDRDTSVSFSFTKWDDGPRWRRRRGHYSGSNMRHRSSRDFRYGNRRRIFDHDPDFHRNQNFEEARRYHQQQRRAIRNNYQSWEDHPFNR